MTETSFKKFNSKCIVNLVIMIFRDFAERRIGFSFLISESNFGSLTVKKVVSFFLELECSQDYVMIFVEHTTK